MWEKKENRAVTFVLNKMPLLALSKKIVTYIRCMFMFDVEMWYSNYH